MSISVRRRNEPIRRRLTTRVPTMNPSATIGEVEETLRRHHRVLIRLNISMWSMMPVGPDYAKGKHEQETASEMRSGWTHHDPPRYHR